MALKLYYHPLASFCQKVLIALYEGGTPFEPILVDLGNAAERAALQQLWPIGKFPVLRDETRNRTIPESTIIIEYLSQHYPGKASLLPADPDLALDTRLQERFFDLYVHLPMQNIVADKLRPADKSDPFGVEQARAQLQLAYSVLDRQMATRTWATGDSFGMADCAAAPSLFYAVRLEPIGESHPHAAAYVARLMQRPSFVRVVEEAKPYYENFARFIEDRR